MYCTLVVRPFVIFLFAPLTVLEIFFLLFPIVRNKLYFCEQENTVNTLSETLNICLSTSRVKHFLPLFPLMKDISQKDDALRTKQDVFKNHFEIYVPYAFHLVNFCNFHILPRNVYISSSLATETESIIEFL